jgi:hypothetical protein
MANPRFAAAAASFARELDAAAENTARLDELKALRLAAWEKIQAGGGELNFVSSTTMNGKSVTINPQSTCFDVFTWCQEAIEAYGGYDHFTTPVDFSGMSER